MDSAGISKASGMGWTRPVKRECPYCSCCHIRTAVIVVLALEVSAILTIFVGTSAFFVTVPKVPEHEEAWTRALGLCKAASGLSLVAALALSAGVVCCIIAMRTLRAELVWPHIGSLIFATAAIVLAVILAAVALKGLSEEGTSVSERRSRPQHREESFTRIGNDLMDRAEESFYHGKSALKKGVQSAASSDAAKRAVNLWNSIKNDFGGGKSKRKRETAEIGEVQRFRRSKPWSEDEDVLAGLRVVLVMLGALPTVAVVIVGTIHVALLLWSVRLSFQLKRWLIECRSQVVSPVEMAAKKVGV